MDVIDQMTVAEYNRLFPRSSTKRVQILGSSSSAFQITEYGLSLYLKSNMLSGNTHKENKAQKLRKLDEWEKKILGRRPMVRVIYDNNQKKDSGDQDKNENQEDGKDGL